MVLRFRRMGLVGHRDRGLRGVAVTEKTGHQSEFGEWFEAQYGKRPSPGKTRQELYRAAIEASTAFDRAKAELVDLESYEKRHGDCLTAWTASKEPNAWR